jgi:hypothetical protein
VDRFVADLRELPECGVEGMEGRMADLFQEGVVAITKGLLVEGAVRRHV